MLLIFRPLQLSDLPEALACTRDGFLYTEETRPHLLPMWTSLLKSGLAVGTAGEDPRAPGSCRLVCFRLLVFPAPLFASEVRLGKRPYFPLHLLNCFRQGVALPLLTAAQIRAASVNQDLSMLCLHSGMPAALRQSSGRRYRVQIPLFNHYSSAGYRLNEYLTEVYSPEERAWQTNMGLRARCVYSPQTLRAARPAGLPAEPFGSGRRPALMGLNAQEAADTEGTAMSCVFHYEEPCFGLSPAEQEMLLFALAELTDEEIARRLGVSFATVRKRWSGVYERVTAVMPGLLATAAPRADASEGETPSHGQQKKRRILQYVRAHMEELRPFPRPRRLRPAKPGFKG